MTKATKTKVKVEERINWLKAIHDNVAFRKRRVYHSGWNLVDSEGYELKLNAYSDANFQHASPDLIVLDLPLPKNGKCLNLQESSQAEDFMLTRLEASLVIGKDSQIDANVRYQGSQPRLYPYGVKNWELQAMLEIALGNDNNRATYYSFGRKEEMPKDKKLIIPVQYFCGRRVEDREGNYQKPIAKIENWSRRELIGKVRQELMGKKRR
jgi:hypothetical protein